MPDHFTRDELRAVIWFCAIVGATIVGLAWALAWGLQ